MLGIKQNISCFSAEETYINLHEMYSENKLQELYKATDGTCLWTMVENSFLDFLADLIGKNWLFIFALQTNILAIAQTRTRIHTLYTMCAKY